VTAIRQNWKKGQGCKNKRGGINTLENQNSIFPKGDKATAEFFACTAGVNILVLQDGTGDYADTGKYRLIQKIDQH
jgi:hypothetical protein